MELRPNCGEAWPENRTFLMTFDGICQSDPFVGVLVLITWRDAETGGDSPSEYGERFEEDLPQSQVSYMQESSWFDAIDAVALVYPEKGQISLFQAPNCGEDEGGRILRLQGCKPTRREGEKARRQHTDARSTPARNVLRFRSSIINFDCSANSVAIEQMALYKAVPGLCTCQSCSCVDSG